MKTGTRNLSFRQKVFFAALLTFAGFLILLAPFSEYLIKRMVKQTLSKSAKNVIESLSPCRDTPCMIDYLQKQERFLFFRVTLIDPDFQVLYDVHPEHEGVEI